MTSAFFLLKRVTVMSGRGRPTPQRYLHPPLRRSPCCRLPPRGTRGEDSSQETLLPFHFGGLPDRGEGERNTRAAQQGYRECFISSGIRPFCRGGGIARNADKPLGLGPRPLAGRVCVSSRDGCLSSSESLPRDCFPRTESSGVFPDFSWIKERHK